MRTGTSPHGDRLHLMTDTRLAFVAADRKGEQEILVGKQRVRRRQLELDDGIDRSRILGDHVERNNFATMIYDTPFGLPDNRARRQQRPNSRSISVEGGNVDKAGPD